MKPFASSLGIRHLVCGSCNACEHEMNALAGPDYDITSRGWEIVASPRHADIVTVSGPMTEPMRQPAHDTLDAVARPRIVVAIGDCAVGTGAWSRNGSGAGTELHAAIDVPGCPPSPEAIIEGIAAAAEML